MFVVLIGGALRSVGEDAAEPRSSSLILSGRAALISFYDC